MEWAGIAAIVGLVGLAGSLMIHIVKYGEEKGSIREQIKRLNQEMVEQKELKDTVTDLKTSVIILNNTVGDLKELLKSMLNDRK